jgi:hypothetical protein
VGLCVSLVGQDFLSNASFRQLWYDWSGGCGVWTCRFRCLPRQGGGWVQPPGGGLFFCPPVWGPVLGPTQWPCTMAHSVPLRRIPTGIAPRWVSIDKHLRSIFLLHWSTTPVLAAQRVPGSASFLLGERCASQLGEGFRARSEQPKSRSRRNYSKTPQE